MKTNKVLMHSNNKNGNKHISDKLSVQSRLLRNRQLADCRFTNQTEIASEVWLTANGVGLDNKRPQVEDYGLCQKKGKKKKKLEK